MPVINTTVGFAKAQATVSNTVLDIDTFGFTAQEMQDAERMILYVNTNAIRVWWNGDDPTTSSGILLPVNSRLELLDNNIRKLKMIRNSTTDSEVAIMLEK